MEIDSRVVDKAGWQAAVGPRASSPPAGGGDRRAWVVAALSAIAAIACTVCFFLPLLPLAYGGAACALMLILIFLRMPIGFAMLLPGLLGLYAMRGGLVVEGALSTLPYTQVANWSLSVIPPFILMGLLLWRVGLTETLYDAGRAWLAWLPGGLGVGTNVAGAGLAAVSGSSLGTTYALARVGIPEMLKAGYDKRLAIGAVIVAGLPGQLIPPSIMLVLYSGIAEVPVGPQLLAGIGPGVLVATLFSVMIVVLGRRWAPSAAASALAPSEGQLSRRLQSLVRVWPVPLIFAVVVAGMYSGTFTASETGAAAALVSIVVVFVWRRDLRASATALGRAVTATVSAVGAIFLLLIGVAAFSRMLVLTGVSRSFADLVDELSLGRVSFLLLMMVIYIVLGTFMEPLPMLVLTVPILIPVLENLDISLLWYGVFAVFMGELAVVTPPVGILSFVIHGIAQEPEVNRGTKVSLNDVFNAAWIFMPMAILVTVILILFPEIATAIPDWGRG